MSENKVEEGKTIAIISYITLIGLIVAFIMNNSKKNSFASFHIRQMIGLSILSLINSFVFGRINYFLMLGVSIALLVLWIIALIGAVNGQEKKIPLLGDQFQAWFKNVG